MKEINTGKIKAIKRVKVSDEVFNQMKSNILSRQWKPGQQLPSENKLGEEFGVSRSTIRSALQKLSAIGMVEVRNGEGTFIKDIQINSVMSNFIRELTFSTSDIIQMLELRQGIEMISCKLAALRRTDEELVELKYILDKMSLYQKTNDIDKYSQEDMKFHIQVAKMSKNSLVESIMVMLKDFILGHLKEVNLYIGVNLGFDRHKHLYQLIRDGEDKLAEELIYIKLLDTINAVRTNLG